MDERNCARLRAKAEHCRMLATHMSNQRSIDALKQTAREFDADADRFEAERGAR